MSKIDRKPYDRYYHFFSQEEFKMLIKISSFESKTVEGKFHLESNNWIFRGVIRRTA
jgi:hypothetical protein